MKSIAYLDTLHLVSHLAPLVGQKLGPVTQDTTASRADLAANIRTCAHAMLEWQGTEGISESYLAEAAEMLAQTAAAGKRPGLGADIGLLAMLGVSANDEGES